jgi:hypothetical protein
MSGIAARSGLSGGNAAALAVTCPLCGSATEAYFRDGCRDFRRCRCCALVHVPRAQHLDRSAELAEYRRHDNRTGDPGYRRFLSRLAEPVLARVRPPARGLDFGCGPGPALAAMLEEAGIVMDLYDPFFYPNPSVFQRHYQLITASEVVEHLACPGRELERLWSLLTPGGWLGIMTQRLPDAADFAAWGYRREPTHVSFFADQTFRYLADRWQADLVFPESTVALLRSPWPGDARATRHGR